jgi:threonyl-tRNA synthetase
MIAILIEHTAGKWPFWLSPRQCVVLPVSEKFNGYAQEVRPLKQDVNKFLIFKKIAKSIKDRGYYADTDSSEQKIQKKIRDAQLAQYNYILVVGEQEQSSGTVNVRTRYSPLL